MFAYEKLPEMTCSIHEETGLCWCRKVGESTGERDIGTETLVLEEGRSFTQIHVGESR